MEQPPQGEVPGSRARDGQPERAPRELFRSVGDAEHMLAILRRELPLLADAEIRVMRCSAKPSKSRRAIKQRRLDVVYRVWIEEGGQPRGEYLLLGVVPAPPELVDGALEQQKRSLRGHPWAAPFLRLSTYVDELRLALLVFPLDPALPGLAGITGSEGARLLESSLRERRAGTAIERIECELVHYKPFDRAVLKIRALSRGPRGPAERTVFAKFFADDQGLTCFRNLAELFCLAQRSTALRVPEPLGYDAERRMLLMAEAPGERDLTEWIKALEKKRSLPAGVDADRLECCAVVVARALLELQGSFLQPDFRRTFRSELARLDRDRILLLAGVRASRPELAADVDRLLERLTALAPAHERLVPAHGGFRHKQMIGDERSLTLIDWDGLALASPALDAATFLARLRREPLRRPGSAPELERMAAAFRREFLEGQPGLEHDLDLYQGLVLTEQMLRSFRTLAIDEAAIREIQLQIEVARSLLERLG